MKRWMAAAALGLVVLAAAAPAHAYVGPGAGIAFLTTALLLVWTSILAALGLLLWPFRQLYRAIRRKRPARRARVERAIVVGLDGLDPDLCRRFMAEGKLPHLSALAARGTFSKLATTYPAMSPVAWSSFATGVDPAKHGIFDFLTRDRGSYLPMLSSAEVGHARRHLRVGGYHIPIGKPSTRLLRKS